MPAAGVVLIIAVVLIVAALAYYLIPTIVALRKIVTGLDEAIKGVGELVDKSAPVNPVVNDINKNLDAAVDALEGLLVKKAGLADAVGLIEGLYPGSAAYGLRNFPDSKTVTPPRIAEVYTKGTLTLARLGREAPIAAASPEGPVLRNVTGGSWAARALYPEIRQTRPQKLPPSPVIGTNAPVQYEPTDEPGFRRRMPATAGASEAAGATAVLERSPEGNGFGDPPDPPDRPDDNVIRWKKD
jgi:hypothetical protein